MGEAFVLIMIESMFLCPGDYVFRFKKYLEKEMNNSAILFLTCIYEKNPYGRMWDPRLPDKKETKSILVFCERVILHQ